MKHISVFLVVLFIAKFGFTQNMQADTTSGSKPFVLGWIHEIQSKILSEKRTLNIYLPEGYHEDDTIRYPVIYLLDGSADEDFIHIAGLVQFNSFPWIARVPKSIVVGIANIDRKKDFTFPTTGKGDKERYSTTGKSENFIAFIEKELQPYIDKKFKTTTSRTLIGQSLGGLLATEILFKKPQLFNRYIIISPSLWWNNGSILNLDAEILREAYTPNTDIYIAVGKEGLTPSDIPRVMEVDANLLAEKLKATKSKSVSVYFDYLPAEDHATIMHQAVFNAFRYLYKAK